MTIYHKHHVIPKHQGGTDDPSNIISLSIENHANAHKKLYEQYGNEKDRVAWLALSGSITKSEAQHLLHLEGVKKGGKISGPKIASLNKKLRRSIFSKTQSFAFEDKILQENATLSAQSVKAKEKRKNTWKQKIENGWVPWNKPL